MALAYALFKLTVFPRSEPLRPMVLHILEDCLIVAAKVSIKCKSILLCAMQLSLAPLIEKSAIILLPCPKANLLDIVAPGSSQELLKGPSAQPHSTSSQVSARRRLRLVARSTVIKQGLNCSWEMFVLSISPASVAPSSKIERTSM